MMTTRTFLSISVLLTVGGIRAVFQPGYAEKWAIYQRQMNRSVFTSVFEIRLFGAALLVVGILLAWYAYLVAK
jgi:hypothetical protein